jgi:hypothetical protein
MPVVTCGGQARDTARLLVWLLVTATAVQGGWPQRLTSTHACEGHHLGCTGYEVCVGYGCYTRTMALVTVAGAISVTEMPHACCMLLCI